MAMTADAELPGDPSDSDDEQVPSSPDAEARRQSIDPVLPRRSSDERDLGWGDQPAEYDDDWYREQHPPHHG
jgi:hypothetical protein